MELRIRRALPRQLDVLDAEYRTSSASTAGLIAPAAIRFEERDLIRFQDGYADYRHRVPMLAPCMNSAVDRSDLTASSPSPENAGAGVVGAVIQPELVSAAQR